MLLAFNYGLNMLHLQLIFTWQGSLGLVWRREEADKRRFETWRRQQKLYTYPPNRAIQRSRPT